MKPSSNARAGFLIVLLAAVFTYGLIRAFTIHFATGEVYPESSSLSSSPEGAKLLYDSLARTPGVTVSRSYYPLEYLEETNATIFVLGLNAGRLEPSLDAIEHLANSGDRVVAVLKWTSDEPPHADELAKRWHVKFGYRPDHLYFTEAPEWRVLDRDGDKLVAIERDFKKGSVVLFSQSTAFSNQATVSLKPLAIISAAIGPNTRVVFDEHHFGIAESGTVVGLARRFRLTGMAAGLAFCAALFLWKNAASFPPPVDAPQSAVLSGRTSLSGLYTLLSRHIKPEDLASTCWHEWLTGKRREVTPERVKRAEAILLERGRKPLDAVREIQTVLQSKGPL